MKDKIIAALNAKFPKLSNDRVNNYATRLESKVKEEADIDAKITELDEVVDFASIIKQDKEVEKLKAEKKEAAKKKEPAKEDEADDEEEEEEIKPVGKKSKTPAYMKELVETVKSLSTKINTLESEKAQKSIEQKIAAKIKGVPEAYWAEWKRPESDTDEDITAFAEKVTKGYEGFTQDLTNKGFSGMSTPKSGAGGAAGTKASDAEIKSILAKL